MKEEQPQINPRPTPLPELIADKSAIREEQKRNSQRKTVKVRQHILP